MPDKEATARIKINRLLEAAGWRFFPDGSGPANIRLEPTVAIKAADLDFFGENFEKAERGFVDFLLLEEEFAKFVADRLPEPPSAIPAIKHYFKAYVTSGRGRDILDQRQFTDLATNPVFSTRDFRAVPEPFRTLMPEYIKDYVSLNQFAA
jgi:type I restriction enzyme R subunit